MKKIIIPSLLAAVVIFLWSMISWTAIGWHMIDVKNLPDGSIVEKMKETMDEHAVYVYPGYPEDGSEEEMAEWTKKYRTGPLVNFLVYSPTGSEPMSPFYFIRGFIIYFISAFIAAVLLMMILAQNPGFMRRVVFIMLLGLFAGFVGPFMEWNWWNYPLGFTVVAVVDLCITWFLAGLVLAWRIKP